MTDTMRAPSESSATIATHEQRRHSEHQPPQPSVTHTSMPHFSTMLRIPVTLKILVGTAEIPFHDLANLGPNRLIELDRKLGDMVDVIANGRLVAQGHMVVVNAEHNHFGVVIARVIEASAL